eukprot:scaffold94_cov242-Ochromonas_danica.AAC.7
MMIIDQATVAAVKKLRLTNLVQRSPVGQQVAVRTKKAIVRVRRNTPGIKGIRSRRSRAREGWGMLSHRGGSWRRRARRRDHSRRCLSLR